MTSWFPPFQAAFIVNFLISISKMAAPERYIRVIVGLVLVIAVILLVVGGSSARRRWSWNINPFYVDQIVNAIKANQSVPVAINPEQNPGIRTEPSSKGPPTEPKLSPSTHSSTGITLSTASSFVFSPSSYSSVNPLRPCEKFGSCTFRNVCVMQDVGETCYARMLRKYRGMKDCLPTTRLLYFTNTTTPPNFGFSFLRLCTVNTLRPLPTENNRWCRLPFKPVSLEEGRTLLQLSSGVNMTYLPGRAALYARWHQENPFHHLLEGVSTLHHTIWMNWGPQSILTTPIFVIDPVSIPLKDTDWAHIVNPGRLQHFYLGQPKSQFRRAICFDELIIGTARWHEEIPVNHSAPIMRLYRSFLYSSAGIPNPFVDPPRAAKTISVVLYLKAKTLTGGLMVNPALIGEVFAKMNFTYRGYKLLFRQMANWEGLSPPEQFKQIPFLDFYIADGGTAGFYGPFMTPGSSALRIEKCMQCGCKESSNILYYWFSFPATNVQLLWYNTTSNQDCVTVPGSAWVDIILREDHLRTFLLRGLDFIIENKKQNPKPFYYDPNAVE